MFTTDDCGFYSGKGCVLCLSGQYSKNNYDCGTLEFILSNLLIWLLEYCPETKVCFNKTIPNSGMCQSNMSTADSRKEVIISNYEQCPSINQCILQHFSFSPFACQVPAIIGFKYASVMIFLYS